MRRSLWLTALACALSMLAVSPTAADDEKPPPNQPEKTPKKTNKHKRVIHSIELATSKKATFTGRLVLRLVNAQGPMLAYHWGCKCKGTKVSKTRLDMMLHAMKERYGVEVPSHPIQYDGRIYMCMQSIRIINE